MQTLSFDDDLPSPTVPALAPRTAETIRAQVAGGILALCAGLYLLLLA